VRKLLERMEMIMSMAETGGFCVGCDLGNALLKHFTLRSDRSQDVGGLIHADVNGPTAVKSFQGAKYYLCFKDDYSKYRRGFSSENIINFPTVYRRSWMNCRVVVTHTDKIGVGAGADIGGTGISCNFTEPCIMLHAQIVVAMRN